MMCTTSCEMMCFSWTMKLHCNTACKVYVEIDNTPCSASCFGWSVLQQLLLNSVLRNVPCEWSNMGLNLMVEVQWTKGWGKMNDSELSDSRMFPHTQNFWLLYSRIHLFWHLWDQTGSELPCSTCTKLTALQVIFWYCSFTGLHN